MNKDKILKNIIKNKKNIVIICVLLIIIIVSIIIYKIIGGMKPPTSIEDFKSIKQVIEYMDSKYISEEGINNKRIKLEFKYPLYNEDKTSNEKYYMQMINRIAEVVKYNNFSLTDEKNDIAIVVECSNTLNRPSKIIVNGSATYFEMENMQNAISEFQKINSIEVKINSNILNSVINNNWNYNSKIFGTLDSTYSGYDIFFEEGIEVKNVSTGADVASPRIIFNIVFNSKYKGNVVNNLTTSSSLDEVSNSLGTPQFGNVEEGLIGYKTDKFYVFFNLKSEISIYPVKTQNNNEFAKVVNSFLVNRNSDELLENLVDIWPYTDSYIENSELNSKELTYTLQGVKAQFNVSNEQGIIIYNNFEGYITESTTLDDIVSGTKKLPDNIYFKNTNLVYENEKERTFYSIDTQFMKQSENYIINSTLMTDESYNLKFISKRDDYPNSELQVTTNTFEFIDDSRLVYSRKNIGIYIYNIENRTTETVIEGNENFEIKKLENGKLSYDDKEITIK